MKAEIISCIELRTGPLYLAKGLGPKATVAVF